MTDEEFDGSLTSYLRLSWREARWETIGTLSLGFTALVFLLELPFFLEGGSSNLLGIVGAHLYVLSWLFVFTVFTRTVSLKTLVSYWFVGVFLVTTVALVLGGATLELLGDTVVPVVGLVIPIIEEGVKLFPVLVFLWLANRTDGRQTTATDATLVGFAVGAGFTFHEELLQGRWLGEGIGGMLGLGETSLALLYPTFAMVSQGFFSAGRWTIMHTGWTTLAATGLGVAYLFRHRLLAWLLPIPPFLFALLDHVSFNYGGPGSGLVSTVIFDGVLPLALLVVAVPGVVFLDLAVIHRTEDRYPFLPVPPLGQSVRAFLSGEGAGRILRLQSARAYARQRRATLLALRRWERVGRPDHAPATIRTVGTLAKAAGIDLRKPSSRRDGSPARGREVAADGGNPRERGGNSRGHNTSVTDRDAGTGARTSRRSPADDTSGTLDRIRDEVPPLDAALTRTTVIGAWFAAVISATPFLLHLGPLVGGGVAGYLRDEGLLEGTIVGTAGGVLGALLFSAYATVFLIYFRDLLGSGVVDGLLGGVSTLVGGVVGAVGMAVLGLFSGAVGGVLGGGTARLHSLGLDALGS